MHSPYCRTESLCFLGLHFGLAGLCDLPQSNYTLWLLILLSCDPAAGTLDEAISFG